MVVVNQILVFVGVLLTSHFLIERWRKKNKPGPRYPPSLPTLPVVGSLPFLRNFNNIAVFFMKKAEELGPVFTFRAGSRLILVLNSREAIEEALVKNSQAFCGREYIYAEVVMNKRRKGIAFMNTTPEWKKYHKLCLSILREFGFGVKSTMETRILLEAEAISEYILKKAGQTFDPQELAFLATSNVIMNIIFGHRLGYDTGLAEVVKLTNEWVHYLDMAMDVAPIIRYIPYYRKKLVELKNCHDRMLELYEEEIAKSLEDESNESFVLKYVQEEGPEYDRDQLKFTLRDIVSGATDTLSNNFLWSLAALANHPEVQTRLHAEIDAVVPRDRLPSLQDQQRLPYVEATILEIQRWQPLIPLSVPRVTMCDSIFSGYVMPSGTLVLPNIYGVHSNPKIWKDPEVFRPERFLDHQNKVIGKDRVISFSIGRRSCFGESLARAETFLFFTSLVQRFIILPPEGQENVVVEPIEPVTTVHGPLPFALRMVERQ